MVRRKSFTPPREKERRYRTLAKAGPRTRNLMSVAKGGSERRVCTANIECRKVVTLPKTICTTPVKGKRTEATLIGKAGNNAPVGMGLIPIERVARLRRRLGITAGNLIGRRQGTNHERFCRSTSGRSRPQKGVKGGTPPFI